MSHYLVLNPYILQLLLTIIIIGVLSKTVLWIGADKVEGIQKYHVNLISRLGGLGIAVSICIGIALLGRYYPNDSFLASLIMIGFTPIFIAGLVEDVTHLVKPRTRILLACVSSIAVLIITQAYVERTDITAIDILLKIPGVSFLITTLIIVGFLNSINLIDGFNGVASGSVLIMTFAISIIAYLVGDYPLLRLGIIIIMSIIGFMCWNWPLGKIFLGDSGAYLLGIWVVMLGILLQYRSSNISPMAPVLICCYPMIETLFTIYRRKYLRSHPISHPDALHLHTLIFRRLIRNSYSMKNSRKTLGANSKVAPYIWIFIIIDSILAVSYYDNTVALIFFISLTYLSYVKIYSSIITFKTVKIFINKRSFV